MFVWPNRLKSSLKYKKEQLFYRVYSIQQSNYKYIVIQQLWLDVNPTVVVMMAATWKTSYE